MRRHANSYSDRMVFKPTVECERSRRVKSIGNSLFAGGITSVARSVELDMNVDDIDMALGARAVTD